MQLQEVHHITFDTEVTILCATLTGPDEWVMLLSTGDVSRYRVGAATGQYLTSVGPVEGMTYSDGGFDLTAPVSIYTMDGIVVVVNDYKTHGSVCYPGEYTGLHLWRKDYRAGITRYPIALFRDAAGIPFLIYSADWNHLQIMNLDTLQVITAAKSLIEEGAEEKYRGSSHPWPGPYDYFFGPILMSPDNSRFLSCGWSWGSSDDYRMYEVADFMSNSRIRDKRLFGGEHSNRAACWVDNDTVAIPYNPWREGDVENPADGLTELRLFDVRKDNREPVDCFPLDAFDEVAGKLYYSNELAAFVAFTEERGLTICDRQGHILLRDEAFRPDGFDAGSGSFITVQDKTVRVHRVLSR